MRFRRDTKVAADLHSATLPASFYALRVRSLEAGFVCLAGAQNVAPTRPLTFCAPEFARSALAAWLKLDRTSVWVLNGYWYPRLTLLRKAQLNSNFVFGTGWWAENGA